MVRTLVDEVAGKFTTEQTKEFFAFIYAFTTVDEGFVVPYPLGEKYRAVLKAEDTAIAAYTEFVGAEAIVTENRRHFHHYAKHLPFAVWDATTCLRELKKHG